MRRLILSPRLLGHRMGHRDYEPSADSLLFHWNVCLSVGTPAGWYQSDPAVERRVDPRNGVSRRGFASVSRKRPHLSLEVRALDGIS